MYSGHGKKTHLKFACQCILSCKMAEKEHILKFCHGKLVLELPIAKHLKELPWKNHIIDKLINGQSPSEKNT